MLKVIALVVPLGLDSFAICAALGVAGIDRAQRRRVLVLFPTLEAAAPLLGLAVGAPLGAAVGGAADYAAIAILLVLGLFTLLGGEQGEGDQVDRLATAHGLAIVSLGLAIALDELAIGFTIGAWPRPRPGPRLDRAASCGPLAARCSPRSEAWREGTRNRGTICGARAGCRRNGAAN